MHWFESKNTKTSLRKHENKAFLKYYELKSSQNFPPPAESGRGMFFFGDFSNIGGEPVPLKSTISDFQNLYCSVPWDLPHQKH